MDIITVQIPDPVQKEAIRQLWNQEYPELLYLSAAADFERYLAPLADPLHLLLREEDDSINGWLFLFEREGEQWFAMIVDRNMQGRGYGNLLLNEAKKYRKVLNGWAVDHSNYTRKDGTVYPAPLEFYYKNGFKIIAGQRMEVPFSAIKIFWCK